MTSNHNPLVTIAIPTYNRASSYLPQALRCATNQTYPNIEIIVSDNCSTDSTEQVVKAINDPRITYVKQENNIGANNNFNYCIGAANGEYILILLDDDSIDNDFIETCINAVKDKPDIGIVRTGTRLIDTNGKILLERPNNTDGLPMSEFILAWFNNETTMYVCSTLFNTKKLRSIGGFKSKNNLFQDVMAEMKMASKFGRIDIRDVKAGFRRHDSNMGSAAKVTEWSEDALELIDILCEAASNKSNLIKKEATRYFCKKMYAYASNIKSPTVRFITYFRVYKYFNYKYSPLGYIYQANLSPKLNRIRKKIFGNNNHSI